MQAERSLSRSRRKHPVAVTTSRTIIITRVIHIHLYRPFPVRTTICKIAHVSIRPQVMRQCSSHRASRRSLLCLQAISSIIAEDRIHAA